MTVEELRAKRDELQATLRANIDRYVRVHQVDLVAEIDVITKKIVEQLP